MEQGGIPCGGSGQNELTELARESGVWQCPTAPQKSPVLYGVGLRLLVTCQKWQPWVVLAFPYSPLLKDLWKPSRRSVNVAQDARCVRVVHLNRNHGCAYSAGETWKPMFVSSKRGEIVICIGAVGTTSGIIVDYYLNIKGAW